MRIKDLKDSDKFAQLCNEVFEDESFNKDSVRNIDKKELNLFVSQQYMFTSEDCVNYMDNKMIVAVLVFDDGTRQEEVDDRVACCYKAIAAWQRMNFIIEKRQFNMKHPSMKFHNYQEDPIYMIGAHAFYDPLN